MNLHITHHHDHAVIVLGGDVDWSSCRTLLDSIGAAVDYYGYQVVEIQVESPGGNGRPFRQLLDGLDAYRAQGVRFRTVVRSNASSAGAILVALGDERVASPSARLLFHSSWIYRRGQLTAQECADLHARLSGSDDKVLHKLVKRAFAGPFTDPVHGAEPSDREVLERLCIGAVLDPEDTAPVRIQNLATALGFTVEEAIEANDRESITRLYRRLFEIDNPISARLAKTLRLVDRVGDSNAGSALGPDSSSFDVPEGIPFASPGGMLAPETLLRHVLVLGDHAGAATSLCLAPMVTALARAPSGKVGPVLVLNPDPELRVALHAVAQERIQVLDPDRIGIDLMARDRSLASALASGRWMTAATSILKRTLDLVPASPARCLLDVSGRVVDAVLREGTHLAVSVVGFILMMMSTRSRCPEGWVPDASRDKGLGADLLERAQGAEGEGGPNVLALAHWLLGVVPGLLPAYAAEQAIHALGTGGEARDVHRGLSAGGEALSCPSGRAWDVLSVAQAVVAPFSAHATRTSIYFGCEPGFEPSEALDLTALVSGARDASFLVIDPKDDGSDGLLAAGIKQLFLEAVLSRSESGVTPRDAPLCGYIARDFERYATDMDRIFLDQAHSVGAFAVLASKSVSAIEHALCDVPGGEATFGALWCAIGTKLFLRSTDPRTQELARGLAPSRPGLPDLLDVRPLPGLEPNSSYVSGVDGRFERRRLVPWAADVPDRRDCDAPPRIIYLGPPPTATREGEPS